MPSRNSSGGIPVMKVMRYSTPAMNAVFLNGPSGPSHTNARPTGTAA